MPGLHIEVVGFKPVEFDPSVSIPVYEAITNVSKALSRPSGVVKVGDVERHYEELDISLGRAGSRYPFLNTGSIRALPENWPVTDDALLQLVTASNQIPIARRPHNWLTGCEPELRKKVDEAKGILTDAGLGEGEIIFLASGFDHHGHSKWYRPTERPAPEDIFGI